MPSNVENIIRKLSPDQRKRVEARVLQLIPEEQIERAFEQFEHGEFFSAEESRADIEKRKAVWLATQKRG